ncbi:MAG: acetylxylan esterase [Verrucomicrobiales bacterium]|nr:acetylxylan esterase [Verrucomicrobiales bacterium]
MSLLLLTCPVNGAEPPAWPINEEESAVPAYVLPELMKSEDGKPVKSVDDWRWKRRPELLRIFEEGMYGKAPARPALVYEVLEEAVPALEGKALRKQVRVYFAGKKEGPSMDVLFYVPSAAAGPVPFFWGLNFQGNHTVSADPGILMPRLPAEAPGNPRPKPLLAWKRGDQADRWQIEWVISQGYGTATAWYEEIDPDYDDGFKNGVHGLFPDLEAKRDGTTWGSLAAWAWGLRVGMDYLEMEPRCDARFVALHGHSRLGKATVWAGAQDERFDVVISNNSGCGGAALSKRWFGETVGRINTSFPHWFAGNYRQWNGREAEMPYDQHELLALVAPRGLLVGSAEDDKWADPEGELIAAKQASPAFELLGEKGLAAETKRENSAVSTGNPGYWQRPGKHDVMAEDWKRWTAFLKARWGK